MDASNFIADICNINVEVICRSVLATVGRLSNHSFFSDDGCDDTADSNSSDTDGESRTDICIGWKQMIALTYLYP